MLSATNEVQGGILKHYELTILCSFSVKGY